jgi:hypothetical protein
MNVYGTPDLVQVVVKKDGHQGYVKASDLNCASGKSDIQNPGEAAAWSETDRSRDVSVPVYESNGQTVIGSMKVGNASESDVQTVPVSSLYGECQSGQPVQTPQQGALVRVPNVVGRLVTQAANTLAKLGLEVKINDSSGSSTPTSRVIAQIPTVGALVVPNTPIVLTPSGS